MSTGFEVTVKHQISHQRVSDLLCSAFESGSNYWISDAYALGEDEIPKKRKLSYATIKRGLRLLSTTPAYAQHWADFLSENDDATTGDVFLQLCLYGEVVYG